PAAANALTPDEARRALETLQDDKRRAEIINTLRAIANAKPPANAQPPANVQQPQAAPAPQAPTADAATDTPLPADSLGAQLLLQVSEQFASISNEIATAADAVTRFPLLWYWLKRTATNPATYDLLFDIAWKLAVVFGCALTVEWLMGGVVRRPIAF